MVVKVKRETLEACMTCPICLKLLKDATTISLCLHTFCRKCIYDKLSDEEGDCCPVCNIDLGILPVEKLRPDHNLQDIRTKIFPFKRKKVEAEEVVPSIPLPAKRKERSLSSLVVNAPKVSTHTGFTGKRTKTGMRKAAALRGCSFITEGSVKKEEAHDEDNLGTFLAETSKKHRPNEDTNNNMELTEGKADLWTPLNCLVEAANRTKSSRSNLLGTPLAKLESPVTPHGGLVMSEIITKSEPPTSVQSELHMPKTKNKSNGHKTKFGDDKDGNTLPSVPVKRKRLRPANQKRTAASEMSASAQLVLDATGSRCNRKNSPIWFTLVASEDQNEEISLPQISACYLRIKLGLVYMTTVMVKNTPIDLAANVLSYKDGTVPVSFIQKYLMKKLNLANEAEVEIICRGQPVLPSLQMHNLVDLWFCTASTSKKLPASVGSSAKDFVMALSYCRKTVPL